MPCVVEYVNQSFSSPNLLASDIVETDTTSSSFDFFVLAAVTYGVAVRKTLFSAGTCQIGSPNTPSPTRRCASSPISTLNPRPAASVASLTRSEEWYVATTNLRFFKGLASQSAITAGSLVTFEVPRSLTSISISPPPTSSLRRPPRTVESEHTARMS